MSFPNKLPDQLLVVTDRHQASRDLTEMVDALLAGGARWIWFRDRDLAGAPRRALALRLFQQTKAAGAVLTIGGDVALAAEVGAQAVHLSATGDVDAARALLGADALIGMSAHNEVDVHAAHANGADYVTLSPIFLSASKPGYGPALGLTMVQQASALGLPILALGGITADRASACLAAGAAGVAVMGEAMRADDPAALVRCLRAELARTATVVTAS